MLEIGILFNTTPANFPFTFFIAFMVFSKDTFLVNLCATTRMVESTILDKITASVTMSQGVLSIITISNTFFNFSINSSVLVESNNSEGFGGILPAGIKYKFGICV